MPVQAAPPPTTEAAGVPSRRPCPRLAIAPYDVAAAHAIEAALGVSHTLAQVLVRRGHGTPAAARAWLEAADGHDPQRFAGIEAAIALVLRHVRDGTPITVHGDYDVDGVCSTAILVRCLRRLGAQADWYLPSRVDDGYGLAAATVDRLAARGTRLLITADCAITAVEEVAAARAAGMDVVVTDHHSPRADGVLPDAPIVHPAVCGYPCVDLCAAGVALKLAQALEAAAGLQGPGAEADADLVALATIADCVPLRGENRHLVREGLRALAATTKPGLRALMRVAQVDPSGLDARAVGFRLAPRINAAGRLYRADAGLELVLTSDDERAAAVAEELDRANAERRAVETQILFAAEAQVRTAGERNAYVLAGDGWHPGVIGIVASRIAERQHRPVVMIALDGDTGTGSGRSIPGFDLLAGLEAAAAHLERHGGHRAAAGCTIRREQVEAFRAAFEAHADAVLTAEDLISIEPVDAVVSGDALDLGLAEELARLGPFGTGNPEVTLLVPAATLSDPRPMGEGKHVRFSVEAGGVRSRAVAFGSGGGLPAAPGVPADATFRLEVNEWNGTVEPRLVLCSARPSEPAPVELVGEAADFLAAALQACDSPLGGWPPPVPSMPARRLVDRRAHGVAGVIGDLVASGESVLVVCADARRRVRALEDRLGGFSLCDYAALEAEPGLADHYDHVVALDPPAHPHHGALLRAGRQDACTHLAWGPAELRFAQQIHEQELGLRASLAALYRDLRDRGGAEGEELEAVLRGDDERPRSAALAGRLLKVLEELHLVSLDRDRRSIRVPAAERTALERSEAFRAFAARLEDGQRFLNEGQPSKAA